MQEPWWKTAVFYQIYPRSFADSNGDGVGDLPGIVSKLDYLAELGISALWVSPFFKSPMDDFGYDISDYCDVDPVFGSLDDARTLIRAAHRRGIKIVFDLVINHTSDRHPWFVEARSSKENPKHDWYIWKPGRDPETGRKLPAPNNWICQFELKSAWWDNDATGERYLGTFTRHQPEVNWRNPELREAMYDVVRFWLDEGVDGFRMDVVNWYVKDELFRSNPRSLHANPDIFQKHIYDRNRPETHEICRDIRKIADSYPGDRVLIGEIFTRNATAAATYQGNGSDELHLAFNMEMLYLKWNARDFADAIDRWYSALPAGGWPNFTLSNHDQPRHASRFESGDAQTDLARMQIASMLLMTLRGTPFIYYGEEIGMKNVPIPKRELVDPTGITFWPLPMGRDGERTPMQWNGADGAGFTREGVRPWLRIAKSAGTVNVKNQMHDSDSLWHWYRALIAARKDNRAIGAGDFAFIERGQKDVLAFSRTAKTGNGPAETVICCLNFSGRKRKIILPHGGRVILGNRRNASQRIQEGEIVLAPTEALLISL